MTLPPMGYELVDWEMSRGRMVRVFIDKLGGSEGRQRSGQAGVGVGSPSTIAPR